MVDNTEQRILAAARKVFVEKGKDGARMQEIADLAGINKSLLHYYFRSKERLFTMVFMEVFAKFFPIISNVFDQPSSLLDKIRQVFPIYIDFLLENPLIPQFVFSEMNKHPDILDQFLKQPKQAGLIAKLEVMIDRSVVSGEIKPIDSKQFLLNLISLAVFPAFAKPILINVLGIKEMEYLSIIESRKQLVAEFFIKAIT